MASRKLQTEIDRVCKKVDEGIEGFEELMEKMHTTTNPSQKEKLEGESKREIKKLQRLRDQIKTWQTSNDIKDKRVLDLYRRRIEEQMERFKVVEKELKTKAFSKEGLNLAAKIDPKEREKQELASWISSQVETLSTQIQRAEAEQESLQAQTKKGKRDPSKASRVEELEYGIERRKWHSSRLELCLRLIENGNLACESFADIKDDVEYYVESNEDPDFEEDEEIYDTLNLEDEEDAFLISSEILGSAPSLPDESPSSAPATVLRRSTIGGSSGDTSAPTTTPITSSMSPLTTEDTPPTPGHRRRASEDGSPPKEPSAATRSVPVSKAATDVKAAPETKAAIEAKAATEAKTTTEHKAAKKGTSKKETSSLGLSNTAVPKTNDTQAPAPVKATPIVKKTPSSVWADNPLTSKKEAASPTPVASAVSVAAAAAAPTTPTTPTTPVVPTETVAQTPAAPEATPAPAPPAAAPQPQVQPQAQPQVQPQTQPQSQLQPQPQPQPQPQSQPQPQPQPQPQMPPPHMPALPFSSNLIPVLADLIPSFEAAQKEDTWMPLPDGSPSPRLQHALDAAYLQVPRAPDMLRSLPPYSPPHPFPNPPPYYPSQPPASIPDAFYAAVDLDTLFFIFYYRPGSHEQYRAAKEIKRRDWRFNTKHLAWFLRASPDAVLPGARETAEQAPPLPRQVTDTYEQGVYEVFDYEGAWCKRRKADFRFYYAHLEDSLL